MPACSNSAFNHLVVLTRPPRNIRKQVLSTLRTTVLILLKVMTEGLEVHMQSEEEFVLSGRTLGSKSKWNQK